MEKAYNIKKTAQNGQNNPVIAAVKGEQTALHGVDKSKNHRLELDGHELISVWGVKGVPTFGEREMKIVLDGEYLLVTGQGLEIKLLDLEKGQLIAKGYVTGMKYSSGGEKGVWKKIFK